MANSNNLSVTNLTGNAVLTLDAYDPNGGGDGSGLTTKQVYEQPLTVLKTTKGSATIAAGATADITLDLTYDDNGKTETRTIYELISARPADLFPVRNSSVMQGIISGTYEPLTIEKTDPADYIQALIFNINLMAYPTSNLAKEYVAALNSAQTKANSASSLDEIVGAFFKGTKQYRNLTLNKVTTASTYATAFAYLWAGSSDGFASFKDSNTFYIYSAGTAGSNTTKAPPVDQGKLELKKSANAPNPASVTDPLGGYTAIYTDPNGKTTTMAYQDGQLVSSTTEDIPAIALRGTFVVKSSMTGKSSDNALIPMLVGRINATQVMGTTVKQSSDGSGENDFWSMFHPKTFQQWLGLFLNFFGVLFAIKFVYDGVQAFRKWLKSKGEDAPPSEIDQMRQEVSDLRDEIRANQQEVMDRLAGGDDPPQLPENGAVEDAIGDARADFADELTRFQADRMESVLESQAEQLQTMAEVEVTPEIEELAGQIRADSNALRNASTPEELNDAIDQATADVPNFAEQLQSIQESMADQLSQQQQDAIKENEEAAEEAQEAAEEAKNNEEDANDGEGGDDDIPIDDL